MPAASASAFTPPAQVQTTGRPAGASGTIEIRMPDGKVYAIYNAIERNLYQTGQLVDNQKSNTILFSKGLGDPIPGTGQPRSSTDVDTNLPRAGSMGLPPAWEMLVYGLCIGFIRATGGTGNGLLQPDIDAESEPVDFDTGWGIERLLFNEYKYNGVVYADGTMLDYPDGRGFVSQSDLTNFSLAQNGRQSPRDRISYVIPIHEVEQIKFQWTLEPVTSLTITQQGRLDLDQQFTVVDVKGRKIGFLQTGGQDGASAR